MTHAKILLVAAIALSGCAGEPEMRMVAGQSATILTTYRNSVRDFAAGQTALNNANERRLDQLRGQRADREAEIANRRDGWELGGKKEALRRFAATSRVRAEDVLADMAPRLPSTPPSALTFDAGSVDAIVKQLVTLRKPVTLERRLEDLVAFGTKLRARYRDNLKAANDAAAEATGNAGDAASGMIAADDAADPDRQDSRSDVRNE